MQRIREIWQRVSTHRVFAPALVAAIMLLLGLLLAFSHTRNVLKIRGPYLAVLTVISVFPIFAFRFFDPHENSQPITVYFLVTAVYFIVMDSPDVVAFLRLLLFERVTSEAIKRLIFGFIALVASAGGVHYAMRLWFATTNSRGTFLEISPIKFAIYAVLQIIYLNFFIAIARDKFGIRSLFN